MFRRVTSVPQKGANSTNEVNGKESSKKLGAEEGTRTPTPLRVHGPEPCASANSATSAWKRSYRLEFASWKSSRTAVGRLLVYCRCCGNCLSIQSGRDAAACRLVQIS